ncbi:unnamed protein product [Mytilus edulis]|uniref:Uncharacterized protein n=1 Tax=Mytilus edulis TaxID=6550 RepID=A0A8S3PPH6_MYTED|nr:unnamed protein product [Mytilus edulis]
MAALSLDGFQEAQPSGLDLFSLPPTQTAIDSVYYDEHRSTAKLTGTAPVEFNIAAQNSLEDIAGKKENRDQDQPKDKPENIDDLESKQLVEDFQPEKLKTSNKKRKITQHEESKPYIAMPLKTMLQEKSKQKPKMKCYRFEFRCHVTSLRIFKLRKLGSCYHLCKVKSMAHRGVHANDLHFNESDDGLLVKAAIEVENKLKLEIVRDIDDGQQEKAHPHFRSKSYISLQNESNDHNLNEAFQTINRVMEEFINKGSNWILNKVICLEVHTLPYSPIAGSNYMELPYKIKATVGIINIRNDDKSVSMVCTGSPTSDGI